FGEPPPSRPGQHLIPGRFMKTTKEPRYQGHPCPRTIGHMRWLVHWFARGTVLDPFAGTGTTLRVCKRINRNCILIEQNPEYCNHIAREHELEVECHTQNT
ncbi:hypothetical protein LCGC14_1409970, partial [marine sediment metagenome]